MNSPAILEPSRGGTGRRLNRARLILRVTREKRMMLKMGGRAVKRRTSEKITARTILLAGGRAGCKGRKEQVCPSRKSR